MQDYMEGQKEEARQYEKTIEQIKNWKPDVSNLTKKLPDVPLNYKPNKEGLIAIRLSLLVLNDMYFTSQAVDAFVNLWRKGLFSTISLPVRLIYELWGAIHYALQTMLEMKKSGDTSNAFEKSDSLTLGARSEVELPWGGLTDVPYINVMDFIRSLKESNPYAEDNYKFLCESCHPSFLRLTTWSQMGPRYNNW